LCPDWNHLCCRKRKTSAETAMKIEMKQEEEDSPHCTENPIYVFPEIKLRGLFPIPSFMYL
jgi:hypothetical protein